MPTIKAKKPRKRQDFRPRDDSPLSVQECLRRYKQGSVTHGVLSYLIWAHVQIPAAPCNTTTIIEMFPTIRGSATLTYMRRRGLIYKPEVRMPQGYVSKKDWRATATGDEFAQKIGPYQVVHYNLNQCASRRKVPALPWYLPKFDVNKGVKKEFEALGFHVFAQAEVHKKCPNPRCPGYRDQSMDMYMMTDEPKREDCKYSEKSCVLVFECGACDHQFSAWPEEET